MPHVRAPPSLAYCALMSLLTILTMILLLGLGLLFLWHVGLTARNCTTIEHYEGVTQRRADGTFEPKPRGAPRERHLYDLGLGENLHQVLGPNPLMWWFPLPAKVQGNGLRYPTYLDHEAAGASGRKQTQPIASVPPVKEREKSPFTGQSASFRGMNLGLGLQAQAQAQAAHSRKPSEAPGEGQGIAAIGPFGTSPVPGSLHDQQPQLAMGARP